MIISKQMAAILGGLFFAAVLGIQLYGCDTANAQQAATERDYALLNPQVADDTAERLDALESAARSAEIEALKQYEQADYDFMRGDAEIPANSRP
jgi:hypothetical protein